MAATDKTTVEKVKGYLNSRRGEFVFLTVMTALAILFTVIMYSVKLTDYSFGNAQRSDMSLWTADYFYIKTAVLPGVEYIYGFNTGFVVSFVGVLLFSAISIVVLYITKNNIVCFIATVCNILLNIACIAVCSVFGLIRGGAVFCGILSCLFSLAALVFIVLKRKAKSAERAKTSVEQSNVAQPEPETVSPTTRKWLSLAVLVCEIAAFVITVIAFFIPLYSGNGVGSSAIPVNALSSDAPIIVTVVFVAMVLAVFVEILAFAATVSDWIRGDKMFAARAQKFITGAAVFTLVFFIVGYCIAFWNNVTYTKVNYYSVAYIPLILAAIVLFVSAVLGSKLRVGEATAQTGKYAKVEPLVVVMVMTAVTFISLALNIISIHVEYNILGRVTNDAALSGYKLLTDYKNLEGGFQTLAFIEFAVLLISGVMFVMSLLSYFAKANFYKIFKASVVANFLFVLLIGLFGLYFKIAQKVNEENLKSLLEYFKITLSGDAYKYEVSSQTIYMLVASFAVTAWAVCRGLFGLNDKRQPELIKSADEQPEKSELAATGSTAEAEPSATDFDACPAFTELDGQKDILSAELAERRKHLFDNPSLPNIVRFIVDYARECRLHLSYSVEDMATFVAGLGASRLAILQGMSGTGKTSLPKIFAEAISGRCEIVEVESSWRDKNELLGYYNEFSKCFTPKKFTQVLYRARLNSSVFTFIVLDEMNLSRIEYYFSDFLSLMENEEDKREIKLSNVKLFRTENGQKIPYDGLTDGHTVRIPPNVWFVGTANRDESTFGISDKVYDRAQTMNFNKRAPKIYSFGAPLGARFVPYDMLLQLFDDAKSSYTFDAENNVAIQKAEALLAPYNISFGNRVLRQMEDFVKIYCACFGDRAAAERDAVERILLSKVVSKLENKIVENKEALAVEFDRLGLKDCGAFIRKLSED